MTDLTILGSKLFRYRFHGEAPPDISDLVLVPRPTAPWLAEIEDPLPVDAPASAQPWCCYSDTIIFYEQPYRVVEGNYADHGRCRTRFKLEDVLGLGGDQWLVQSGSVAWSGGRWVMVWRLRRLEPDRRLEVA